MKKLASILILVVVATVFAATTVTSADGSLSSWPFFLEVSPRSASQGIYELNLPLQVMDKSREDLADLRLYDAAGREIPYALRVRREIDDRREVTARAFNQVKVGTASEMSVDLGENPAEHNQTEIETAGANFRRRIEVEGSDSGKEWRMLKTGEVIFRFQSQNGTVESNRVSYPISRYKYLRVRVFGDELTDKEAPPIAEVKVLLATREKGELTTWNVTVPSYQLLRSQGAPTSSWTIDLGGRVPCDRLSLDLADESFSRPFQLEAIDDTENTQIVASGELTRHVGEARKPLVITFDREEYARKLRLLVTDYNNQTLSISSIAAAAPARQLVFELKEPANQPLRLFFGNAKAGAPHYDYERELPSKLGASPNLATALVHTQIGAVVSNPDYKPEPLPLTERVPWMIYIVLTFSSLALALILISLARASLQKERERGETNV